MRIWFAALALLSLVGLGACGAQDNQAPCGDTWCGSNQVCCVQNNDPQNVKCVDGHSCP